MPIGTISLKYTTKNFPIKKRFDTRVNIKDTIEYLRFSTVFNNNGVGVAFIDSPKNSVENNILIKDTSVEDARNSRKLKKEQELLEDSFLLDFASFYITDIAKTVDGEEVPLYFWHDLSLEGNISKIEILDANKAPVKQSLHEYYDESVTLGETRRGVYTNLQCKIDKRENSYEAYYIRYLKEDTNEIEVRLLDARPFYSQASFLSERTNREYTLNQIGGNYEVDVIFDSLNYSPTGLPSLQRFFIQARDKTSVFVEKPAASLVTQRWNLRISPGDFIKEGRRYWVPEYYTQLYSPTIPFRLEKERELTVLGGDILYTDLFPIANLEIEGFFLYVIVKDETGAVTKAFTNDPDADTYITKLGFVTDVFYEKDVVDSISSASGFIKLNQKLTSQEKVFMTYRYEENYFTYSGLSVNPSISAEILGKRIVMYCKPDESARSVHHVIANDSGVILESSDSPLFKSFSGTIQSGSSQGFIDEELGDTDYYSGFEIEFLSGENSGIRTKITAFDGLSFSIAISDTLPTPLLEGDLYRVIKKVADYDSPNSITTGTHSYIGLEGYSTSNYHIKLADVYVIQNLNVDDITSFDSRILGGGLKESQESAGLQLQDEGRWYWDIGNFDGTPYPGMGAVLVRLPRYILKELGGAFEREQVEQIVRRHIADGSYPVIRYYDKSTEIKRIIPGDKVAYLEWDLIDASTYNIYVGNSSDNLFLYASQPGTRNEIDITNLENNKIYYVQVEPIVGGRARLRSKTVSFVPFNYSTLLPSIKYGDGVLAGGTYE
jgi:hypothetical protein